MSSGVLSPSVSQAQGAKEGIVIGDALYSGVLLAIDSSLVPEEKRSETPSMRDGLELHTETELRILGCELIQSAGILLRLPQVNAVDLHITASLLIPHTANSLLTSFNVLLLCYNEVILFHSLLCFSFVLFNSLWLDLKIATEENHNLNSALLYIVQVAMATGQVLFQRFFYSKSFIKHNFEVNQILQ